MIHIYSGDGKGKTTCAYGLAMRCAGWGGRVTAIRFLKPCQSGELLALNLLPGGRTVCFEQQTGFYHTLTDAQKAQVREAAGKAMECARQALLNGEADLLIMDEVLDAVELGIVSEDGLLSLLELAGGTEVVLTGRRPTAGVIALADYHTEMLMRRHPYESGVRARKGVEY